MWFPLQLLAITCWSFVNVLDSLLVQNYDRRPYVLQWHQSFFTLPILAFLALTHGFLVTPWALPLFLAGVVAYAGDWTFFIALNRIDISVTNIAWAILAIFLSIGGIVLFGEQWSWWQATGVVLLLGGSGLLSLWGKHLDGRGFLLLVFLALLYAPFYLVQKSALTAGESVFLAFFWPLLGREILAGALPLIIPSWRRDVFHVFRTQKMEFPFLNSAVVMLFFLGIFLTAEAFAHGPVSLVAVLGNVQAFIVLLFAWILWKVAPFRAARELLTRQAVGVKIVSFCVVFAGLMLLAVHP